MPNSYSLLDYVGIELVGKTAGVLQNATLDDFFELVDMVDNARRVFIVGAGRSGLVGRFFAMRLMHLGGVVHMVGDTTTPATGEGDLLVAISGSGKTPTTVHIAHLAKSAGAKVVSISLKAAPATPLADLSDLVIRLDRRTNSHLRLVYTANEAPQERASITPMGTVFELATLVYLESLVAELIRRRQVMEHELKLRHANLE